MKAKKLKELKPKFKNLYLIGRVTYEATGNDYWLYIAENAGASLAMGQNWFELFYQIRNNALNELKQVDKFSYNLVKLNGNKVPFLYNSL